MDTKEIAKDLTVALIPKVKLVDDPRSAAGSVATMYLEIKDALDKAKPEPKSDTTIPY